MTRAALRGLVSALLAIACSADAAPEPEPTVLTPGAFVATSRAEGGYLLWRTLSLWYGDASGRPTLILAAIFDAEPRTVEEARALARSDALRESSLDMLPVPDEELATVVWFRTLTAEELEIVR